jgi:hypothetical protein
MFSECILCNFVYIAGFDNLLHIEMYYWRFIFIVA